MQFLFCFVFLKTGRIERMNQRFKTVDRFALEYKHMQSNKVNLEYPGYRYRLSAVTSL